MFLMKTVADQQCERSSELQTLNIDILYYNYGRRQMAQTSQ